MPAMRRTLAPLAVTLALVALLGGCTAAADKAANPTPFDAEQYRPAFDAAVQVLRDRGFAVARSDYRHGVVTTKPEAAPTALEPWRGQNASAPLATVATLNDLRRIVTVTLEPTAGDRPDGPPPAPAPAPAPATQPDRYTLRVEVLVEREQTPIRRLSGVTGGNVFDTLEAVPTELKRRGIEGRYWVALERDPALEQVLLREIVERAGL